MFLDLHVHSYYSKDSTNKPELLLKVAAKNNIGFAITDHNNCKSFDEFKRLNLKYKVPIIFGEEIKVFNEGRFLGEIIAYFLNEEVKKGELAIVLDKLREQEAIISVPHPFDFLRGSSFNKNIELLKGKIDAIEIFNSRCYFNFLNNKAKKFGEKNALSFTAGSDAHFIDELGNALVYSNSNDLESFRNDLLKNNVTITGKLSHIKFRIYSTLVRKEILKKEYFYKSISD